MKSKGHRHVLDLVATALADTVGIECEHRLYPFLYDAASTARQHRLPINVDSLAFTIARTPALYARWTAPANAEDTLTHHLAEALSEYETPAVGREAA